MAGLLGGGARDLGAPIINAKKCQRRALWEAVPEIRERSPSTLKNIDGGPLGGGAGDPGAPTINAKKHRRRAPWEAMPKIQERPPSTLKNIDCGLPGRC
jgi:hypothetical protein